MRKFQIIDPNATPSKRLIAETDFIDIAEILAPAYYARRYGPEHNRYVHEAKPVFIRWAEPQDGEDAIIRRYGTVTALATGKIDN